MHFLLIGVVTSRERACSEPCGKVVSSGKKASADLGTGRKAVTSSQRKKPETSTFYRMPLLAHGKQLLWTLPGCPPTPHPPQLSLGQ